MPAEQEPLPQVPDYSAKMPQIMQTAKAAGVTLSPLSKNLGDGLLLNTVDAGAKFGDAQLASLETLGEIVDFLAEQVASKKKMTAAVAA